MGTDRRIDLIIDIIIDMYAERTSHAQRGVYSIFVETVKPIGARKMQAIDATDLRPAPLRAQYPELEAIADSPPAEPSLFPMGKGR